MDSVRVIYHREGDRWWAESPQVVGWSAAGESYEDVAKLAEEGVPFALGRDVKLEHCMQLASESRSNNAA